MSHRRRHLMIAAATVALGLLLAGCSGGGEATGASQDGRASSGSSSGSTSAETSAPPASSDQSKVDACLIVKDSFEEFSSVSSTVDASNPQGAIDAFKDLSAKTTDALASITNAEVKPAATKAATALGDYVTFLETVVSDPSQASEMSAKVTDLQEGFTEVATICAG